MQRQRLDQALVLRGLAESRTRAQALIRAGLVLVDGQVAARPSEPVAPESAIRLTGRDHPWVSRGGVKLDHALSVFAADPAGLVCLDVGASTGGFTDVLLARGAARVYAVDVGREQFASRLRDDPRVVLLEGTDARRLSGDLVPEPVDLLVCDASFISLSKLLAVPLAFVRPGGRLVALVKPQFEVGPQGVGKGGVVRDETLRRRALADVADWLSRQPGWRVLADAESPIAGEAGNREFLLFGAKDVA